MATPPRRPFASADAPPRPDSRDAALDDTIESSFPASDPPSSIPDPEPEFPASAAMETVDALRASPMFWAALGAVAISAVWLGFAWQRRRLSW